MQLPSPHTITTDEGEANVLSHIRHDWKCLHFHPWVDAGHGDRKHTLRRYIRNAIKRVRAYRAARAKRAAQTAQ